MTESIDSEVAVPQSRWQRFQGFRERHGITVSLGDLTQIGLTLGLSLQMSPESIPPIGDLIAITGLPAIAGAAVDARLLPKYLQSKELTVHAQIPRRLILGFLTSMGYYYGEDILTGLKHGIDTISNVVGSAKNIEGPSVNLPHIDVSPAINAVKDFGNNVIGGIKQNPRVLLYGIGAGTAASAAKFSHDNPGAISTGIGKVLNIRSHSRYVRKAGEAALHYSAYGLSMAFFEIVKGVGWLGKNGFGLMEKLGDKGIQTTQTHAPGRIRNNTVR